MGTPPDTDPLIGQLVGGRYQVLRLIGKGGAGSIYEVRNVRLGRSFALKTLAGDAAASVDAIQRFRREAEIVARIKHPNIVEVIDWDELPDGSPCIVMEYLKGEDLAARIRSAAPLPWPLIARVADQVLAALTVTHASGIVHRDLKPPNVFLALDDEGEERVRLLDFGVSKIRDLESVITTDSRLVGTPAYMAPEQAEGRAADIGTHTDVWAMAIMLHEMATGVRAFDGLSMPALLYAICHAEPVAILDHRPDAPAAFVELIRAALVRPINKRLADVATMRGRLRESLREIPSVHSSRDLRPTPPTGVDQLIASRGARKGDALADTAPAGITGKARPTPVPEPAPPPPPAPDAAVPSSGRAWARYAVLGAGILGAVGITYAVVRQPPPEAAPSKVVAVPVEEPPRPAPSTETSPPLDAADVAIDAAVDGRAITDDRKRTKPTGSAQAPMRDAQTPERIYIQNATKALNAHIGPLLECFNANEAEAAGGDQIKATIEIGANGHAQQVSFTPARIETSALGTCLRAEILRVGFPASERDQTFSIPLRATSR